MTGLWDKSYQLANVNTPVRLSTKDDRPFVSFDHRPGPHPVEPLTPRVLRAAIKSARIN